MAKPDLDKIAEYYSGILKELGADLDSDGLKETPLRDAKALVEMTEGSRMETDQLTNTSIAPAGRKVLDVVREPVRELYREVVIETKHHKK